MAGLARRVRAQSDQHAVAASAWQPGWWRHVAGLLLLDAIIGLAREAARSICMSHKIALGADCHRPVKWGLDDAIKLAISDQPGLCLPDESNFSRGSPIFKSQPSPARYVLFRRH